jgi:NAD(P)-dependent dehydrogenase (short-subunit alcohol dehydrogenase family)
MVTQPANAKRIVIVTGGTGELGQFVTRKFHSLGARVVIPFISEQEMQTFCARNSDMADDVRFFRLDVRDEEKVQPFVDMIAQTLGGPDIAVNLIGGYAYGPPVMEAHYEDLQRMIDLNLVPTFNVCRAVLPYMVKQSRGKIVNVGARAGLEGSARLAAYSIGKASVIRLTESLAEEVKHNNVNVNCVLPSIIDTAPNRRDMPGADFSHWVAPADLAEVIAFLASDAARAINGAAIPVFGQV